MHNLNFDSWSIVLLAGLISFGWLQFHSVKYAWTSNTVYSNIPAKAGCARCEQQNSIFYWKLANRKAHRLPILCIGYTIPAAHRHSPTQTKCEWWRFAFHDLVYIWMPANGVKCQFLFWIASVSMRCVKWMPLLGRFPISSRQHCVLCTQFPVRQSMC